MRVRQTLCAVAVCAGLTMPAAADDGVTLEVGERITLRAEGVLLRRVLVELSEAVPFALVERGEMPGRAVSFDFEASDWADAIGMLLRRDGYSLTTDGATGLPRMLVVDWDVVGEARAAAVPAGDAGASGAAGSAGDVESRIRAVAAHLLKPRDPAAEAVAAVAAARLALDQARAHAEGTDGSSIWRDALAKARADYAGALRDLGNHDDGRSVEALVEGLVEDDPEARLGALEALRYQSSAARNSDALDAVASALDTTRDPVTERAALEVLVRYGDPAAIMVTLEDLALTEGPNQDLAAREWLRIREEQKSQALMESGGDPQPR